MSGISVFISLLVAVMDPTDRDCEVLIYPASGAVALTTRSSIIDYGSPDRSLVANSMQWEWKGGGNA